MNIKGVLSLFGLISCIISPINGKEINEYKPQNSEIVSCERNFLNLESVLENNVVKIKKLPETHSNYFVSVIRQEDNKVFGKAQTSEEGEICFRYFPERFRIELEAENEKGSCIIENKDNLENQILKTIIIDRDSRPQRVYLIEGNNFNPFAYIIKESLVATGNKKRVDEYPTDATPLGYYYIKDKQEKGYNGREGRNWEMPFVLWYTKKSGTPEGTNGLHGYKNTKFGYPASHGCVREPKEFSKIAFEWAEIGTPLLIIGNERENDKDSERFNFSYYPEIKKILADLISFKKDIDNGNYDKSFYSKEDIRDIKNISDFARELRGLPFKEQVF